MRIVILGAGGFLGGTVCEEIYQRNDIEQLACIRKWASAVRLARRGIEIRRVDLEDRDSLSQLLAGADAVINTSMPPSSREPELATNLYRACDQAGVRRFIQLSSAAVYGDRTGEVSESMSPEPLDDYGRGKVEMERRLLEAANRSTTQLCILRPSIIYGPFSGAWTVRFVERIVRGRWRTLGRIGNGTCNLVHARDVARLVIAAATSDIAPGPHVLNVNGPDVVSWNEYIKRLGDALGIPDRTTPNAVLFFGAAIVAGILRLGSTPKWVRALYRQSNGKAKSVMTSAQDVTLLYPTQGELNLLARKVHYSTERATQVLGLSPSISFVEGVRQSVEWCRIHGIA
jgi:nucleoside-diphosphate-sugar epimerase